MNSFSHNHSLLRLLAPLIGAALAAFPAFAGTSPVIREFGEAKASGSSKPVIRGLVPDRPPPAEAYSPLGFSIFPAVEVPPPSWGVAFLRVNLFGGRHREVYGLDVGAIGSETAGEFVGIQTSGIYNRVGESPGGLQFAGILNRSAGDFAGMQTAVAGNVVEGTMTGFQFGLVNRTARLEGLQIGFFNIAETGSGVQIGLWNSSQSLEGLQIGIGNVNTDSSMPFFPVINFAF